MTEEADGVEASEVAAPVEEEVGDDEPASSSSSPSLFERICGSCCNKNKLAGYQEMYISPKVFNMSMYCLRFAVFVDAIAGTIEQPNYPIM